MNICKPTFAQSVFSLVVHETNALISIKSFILPYFYFFVNGFERELINLKFMTSQKYQEQWKLNEKVFFPLNFRSVLKCFFP